MERLQHGRVTLEGNPDEICNQASQPASPSDAQPSPWPNGFAECSRGSQFAELQKEFVVDHKAEKDNTRSRSRRLQNEPTSQRKALSVRGRSVASPQKEFVVDHKAEKDNTRS